MKAETKSFFYTFLARLGSAPFWALFTLFPTYVYKDLGGPDFLCGVMVTVKPLSALLSVYWGGKALFSKQLPFFVAFSEAVKFLPFMLLPFFNDPYYAVFALALFMLVKRGGIPYFLELIKQTQKNPGGKEKTFAASQLVDYLSMAIFPLFLGSVLDENPASGVFLISLTAFLGSIFSLLFLLLKIPQENTILKEDLGKIKEDFGPFAIFLRPFKRSFNLLMKERFFCLFQAGFAFSGGGLMVMQAVLPLFFVDVLGVSYTELLVALALFKGVGYGISMPFWSRFLSRKTIFKAAGIAFIFAASFPAFLLISLFWGQGLNLAYFVYGVFISGSDLIWNLSAPYFSEDKESIDYTKTNLLSVGIRGLFIPPSAIFLAKQSSVTAILFFGGALCFFGAVWMLFFSLKERESVSFQQTL